MTRHRTIRPGPIGPDVDLDQEDIRLANGRRLTEQGAEELAERTLKRHRGRPSLSDEARHTPSLTVRVPSQVRDALEAIASAQGRRVADVSRDAFSEYIDRHAS